jgi:hypothetical protein
MNMQTDCIHSKTDRTCSFMNMFIHEHADRLRSFKNFDEKQFLEDLNQCKWSSINEENEIDTNLDIWYDLFVGIIDKYLPVKTKRVQRMKQPD